MRVIYYLKMSNTNVFQRNLSEVRFENKSLFSFVNGVITDKKYTWSLKNEHIE